MTSLGPVSVEGRTSSANYGVYGRAGWISRLSPRDEVAASVEVWQLWQRVTGYSDPSAAFNPFDATIADGTDRTNLVKSAGNGRICSAIASKPISMAASCSPLPIIPELSPP